MKLSQRLTTLVKTAINDVLGEETVVEARPPGRASKNSAAEQLAERLSEAQARLDALQVELAEAVQREERVMREWQSVRTHAEELDLSVDIALQAGQDEKARQLLQRARQVAASAQELAELRQACEALSQQIRSALAFQQNQLDMWNSRYQAFSLRERSAEALEEMLQVQREISSQSEALHEEFQAQEERLAQREDRLAARREWLAVKKDNDRE